MQRHKMVVMVGALLVAGLTAGALPAGAQDRRLESHVLNRLAFGPDAASVAEIERLGVDGWVSRQLQPETIAEPAALVQRLAQLETQALDAVTLRQRYEPPPAPPGTDPEAIKAAQQRAKTVVDQASSARLLRAIGSPRQLQEVMVDFWFNHFNIFAQKGLDRLWVGDFENRAIRPYALGRFRDLLGATAHHPAMLFYLDNWQNTAPGSPGAKGGKTGLNENYARELMELHTLGVDGGYTQDDVIALARILTGWGIARPGAGDAADNGFVFEAKRHDFGDKLLLGRTVKGQGTAEVEYALDLLATSPATARHLSFELAQYFVADQPPPALVNRLARRWQESGGDLRAVLSLLFASPEFRAPAAFGAKFKTPFQYVVSAVRAGGLPVSNLQPLLGTLNRLGQPLYGCLTPDGYHNTRAAWLNPDALSLRLDFASALGGGTLPLDRPAPGEPGTGATPPAPAKRTPTPLDSARLATLVDLSPPTQATVAAAAPPLRAALILGSPEFLSR